MTTNWAEALGEGWTKNPQTVVGGCGCRVWQKFGPTGQVMVLAHDCAGKDGRVELRRQGNPGMDPGLHEVPPFLANLTSIEEIAQARRDAERAQKEAERADRLRLLQSRGRAIPAVADLLEQYGLADDPTTWRNVMRDWDRDAYRKILDAVRAAGTGDLGPLMEGGEFVLDIPAEPVPLWGRGADVLMAQGEALMIAGLQGLGKTTIAQQLALGRCGLTWFGELFGLPILPGAKRTLYLAMDRPQQAARSFHRMVRPEDRAALNERLVVRPGPPPVDLAADTSMLLQLCTLADADTVVVDSLKDAVVGLNKDEVAAGWNRALQTAIAAGVEVVVLHHTRKASGGKIEDVFGSTWITSGTGSVLLLSGEPGDLVIGLEHAKQPAAQVGPWRVLHDHVRGRSALYHQADLVAVVSVQGSITAVQAAQVINELPTGTSPTPGQKEKARRKLEQLEKDGLLVVVEKGDRSTPKAWGLAP